ncbi:hypothetical protein CLOM_g1606 [Closterium sp. NIES-68]|nr:hypothetical protein CLOM_g1606 [Closterium sp. NIES-68]
MGAGGEEDEEEKGGKVDERRPGFFFFVNEGAADPAMAAKVLLHPLSHWVIDSGSSWHMTPRVDLLDEIQPAPIATVTSATGAKAKVMGMGRAMFVGADGELIPVLPWPKGNEPAAAAAVEGAMDDEDHEECDEGLIAAAGASAAVKASATSGQASWETWHRRLAHVAVSTLEVMAREQSVQGLRLVDGSAKAPLEVVHMDLVGPMRTEGIGGALYFLTLVDDWSRFTWARPLSKKSDAAAAIKEDWLPMVERQSQRLVKVLRSDRGGEFLGADFTSWLKKNGIRHQLTCPGTPQQNGIAERANRTIGEAAKALLRDAGLPYKFWPEAVR